MPSKSKKQHNLMALVANNPKAANRLGIPKSVGEEFMKADKGRKFKGGGEMKGAGYKQQERRHVAAMKKAGVPKNIVKEEMKEAGMKKGGKVKKMADGGATQPMPKATLPSQANIPTLPSQASDRAKSIMAARLAARKAAPATTTTTTAKPAGMKKGGACKKMARGGGVEVRGKTKGKFV